MKRLSFLVLLLAFLPVGCAHRPSPVSPLSPSDNVVSTSEEIPLISPEVSVTSGIESADGKDNPENGEEGEEGEEEEGGRERGREGEGERALGETCERFGVMDALARHCFHNKLSAPNKR